MSAKLSFLIWKVEIENETLRVFHEAGSVELNFESWLEMRLNGKEKCRKIQELYITSMALWNISGERTTIKRICTYKEPPLMDNRGREQGRRTPEVSKKLQVSIENCKWLKIFVQFLKAFQMFSNLPDWSRKGGNKYEKIQ